MDIPSMTILGKSDKIRKDSEIRNKESETKNQKQEIRCEDLECEVLICFLKGRRPVMFLVSERCVSTGHVSGILFLTSVL